MDNIMGLSKIRMFVYLFNVISLVKGDCNYVFF